MDIQDLRPALAMIDRAGEAALEAAGPEVAIRALAGACFELLGDREAHARPGALKDGERQFMVAGAFFVTPDARYHMLVGNVNFPPEQQRLMVPIDGGHPGWVYANRSKLILRNTDEHGAFRQYLKTSRMGSAIFAPIVWQGAFLGQLIMAAQARFTMRDEDLAVLVACSRVAAGVWIAHGGPAWLDASYPPRNGFYVDREGM
ncbi:GAF domain-containing protein [Vineibacter terrae]|uniref:GAF domain-containing protein n=1 Tax=Vineibacter terrae TaxID=2586908 RepID=A0A5C8PPG9_9HYPH|nr:GAF domain-containing protein [Vineibacter terrae]TXL76425.1 GAF domain-containing protein [Vineibacter terrae]